MSKHWYVPYLICNLMNGRDGVLLMKSIGVLIVEVVDVICRNQVLLSIEGRGRVYPNF